MAVLNLVDLHRETSDFSAQGISRTLALAVEAASRTGMRLEITHIDRVLDQIALDTGSHEHSNVWEERIPLLNGSMPSGDSTRQWTGRTVEVRKVLTRWCRLEYNHDGV